METDPRAAPPPRASPNAFRLVVRLMVVTAIAMAVLVAIALPGNERVVMGAREQEAKSNLAALARLERSYFAERDRFLAAGPSPVQLPGPDGTSGPLGGGFDELGFHPEGPIRYRYRAALEGDAVWLTATADLDSDGRVSEWVLEVRPDGAGELRKRTEGEY